MASALLVSVFTIPIVVIDKKKSETLPCIKN